MTIYSSFQFQPAPVEAPGERGWEAERPRHCRNASAQPRPPLSAPAGPPAPAPAGPGHPLSPPQCPCPRRKGTPAPTHGARQLRRPGPKVRHLPPALHASAAPVAPARSAADHQRAGRRRRPYKPPAVRPPAHWLLSHTPRGRGLRPARPAHWPHPLGQRPRRPLAGSACTRRQRDQAGGGAGAGRGASGLWRARRPRPRHRPPPAPGRIVLRDSATAGTGTGSGTGGGASVTRMSQKRWVPGKDAKG